jgi:carbonic anhydrase/acetyltransferase-like protein (isoleucine patch superfamily)
LEEDLAMLIKHLGKTPQIHPEAYIAPNAVICGDVVVESDCRILFGAQVIAEGGSIELRQQCIVMENAVLRASDRHPLSIGSNCLIGPNAHVVGCRIEDEVFVATGVAIFHGAHLGKGCEVRVNSVVHLKTRLPDRTTVPIGWVAVGDPAEILPPDRHERIWEIQRPLNFPLTVYGIDRAEADMVKITRRLAANLASHRDNREEH